MIARTRQTAESGRPSRSELATTTDQLIEVEQYVIALLEGLDVTDRRRLGKVFRIRRDALLRNAGAVPGGGVPRRSCTKWPVGPGSNTGPG